MEGRHRRKGSESEYCKDKSNEVSSGKGAGRRFGEISFSTNSTRIFPRIFCLPLYHLTLHYFCLCNIHSQTLFFYAFLPYLNLLTQLLLRLRNQNQIIRIQ